MHEASKDFHVNASKNFENLGSALRIRREMCERERVGRKIENKSREEKIKEREI